MTEPGQIFVNYSRTNGQIVRRLVAALEPAAAACTGS
jgi:hypothetical protein